MIAIKNSPLPAIDMLLQDTLIVLAGVSFRTQLPDKLRLNPHNYNRYPLEQIQLIRSLGSVVRSFGAPKGRRPNGGNWRNIRFFMRRSDRSVRKRGLGESLTQTKSVSQQTSFSSRKGIIFPIRLQALVWMRFHINVGGVRLVFILCPSDGTRSSRAAKTLRRIDEDDRSMRE